MNKNEKILAELRKVMCEAGLNGMAGYVVGKMKQILNAQESEDVVDKDGKLIADPNEMYKLGYADAVMSRETDKEITKRLWEEFWNEKQEYPSDIKVEQFGDCLCREFPEWLDKDVI